LASPDTGTQRKKGIVRKEKRKEKEW